MYEAGALPKDCPSGGMVWTDKNFVAKFDECKKMMEKEGKDTSQYGKIKCPKEQVISNVICFLLSDQKFIDFLSGYANDDALIQHY